MENLGASLMARLKPGMWVYLHGDLGTGKTTLVRGALRSIGYSGPVKSPTFTLVEQYPFLGSSIYHFDLYRISDTDELEYMGLRDYFSTDSLCFVEWPEQGAGVLPSAHVEIFIAHDGPARTVEILTSSDIQLTHNPAKHTDSYSNSK